MKSIQLITHPKVESVFENYPNSVRKQMRTLRKLILETAEEMEEIKAIEETLKWGEPAYLTKNGSTLRIDWKAKLPNQFAIYFQCTSSLIPTFKTVFKHTFCFEGNRAIVFKLDDQLPLDELKRCIAKTLQYHKVKHLPLLGL